MPLLKFSASTASMLSSTAAASISSTVLRGITASGSILTSRTFSSTSAARSAAEGAAAGAAEPTFATKAEAEVYHKLKGAFEPTELHVADVSGGCGAMYEIKIISNKFNGTTKLQQQRLVNQVLKEELKNWHASSAVARRAAANALRGALELSSSSDPAAAPADDREVSPITPFFGASAGAPHPFRTLPNPLDHSAAAGSTSSLLAGTDDDANPSRRVEVVDGSSPLLTTNTLTVSIVESAGPGSPATAGTATAPGTGAAPSETTSPATHHAGGMSTPAGRDISSATAAQMAYDPIAFLEAAGCGAMYIEVAEGIKGRSGSFSVSPSGRDVVVTGYNGLVVLNLARPLDEPRMLDRERAPLVANFQRQLQGTARVQWNPHAVREHWIASTERNTVLLWNALPPYGLGTPPNAGSPSGSPQTKADLGASWVGTSSLLASPPSALLPTIRGGGTSAAPPLYPSSAAVQRVLSGHTRTVTDLHWSPFQPDLLATSALDGQILLWDLRKPGASAIVNTFASWPRVVHRVRWNPANPWLFAGVHSDHASLWDIRHGSLPIHAALGHPAGSAPPLAPTGLRVTALDWHPSVESELLTAGMDGIVHVWNSQDPAHPVHATAVGHPVADARYSPDGAHVVTVPYHHADRALLWSTAEWDAEPAVLDVTGAVAVDWRGGSAPPHHHGGVPGAVVPVGAAAGGSRLASLGIDASAANLPGSAPISAVAPAAGAKDYQLVAWTTAQDVCVVPITPVHTHSVPVGASAAAASTATSAEDLDLAIVALEDDTARPLSVVTHRHHRHHHHPDSASTSAAAPTPTANTHSLVIRRRAQQGSSKIAARTAGISGNSAYAKLLQAVHATAPGIGHGTAREWLVTNGASLVLARGDEGTLGLSGELARRLSNAAATPASATTPGAAGLASAGDEVRPVLKSLPSEMLWVAGRYADVKFERVDLAARVITFALKGPWGPDGALTPVRVTMAFPDAYPAQAGPSVTIHDVGQDVARETAAAIDAQLAHLIQRNTARGRVCLEPCLRFLLGQTGGRPVSGGPTPTALTPGGGASFANGGAAGAPWASSPHSMPPTPAHLLPTSPLVDDDLAEPGLDDTDSVDGDAAVLGGVVAGSLHMPDGGRGGLVRGSSSSAYDGLPLPSLDAGVRRDYDSCIPFPRLASVAWSPTGKLAVFTSPFPEIATPMPRSLDQFQAFKNEVAHLEAAARQNQQEDGIDGNEEEEDLLIPNLYFPKLPTMHGTDDMLNRFRSKFFPSTVKDASSPAAVSARDAARSSSARKRVNSTTSGGGGSVATESFSLSGTTAASIRGSNRDRDSLAPSSVSVTGSVGGGGGGGTSGVTNTTLVVSDYLTNKPNRAVVLVDMSHLLPFDVELAAAYRMVASPGPDGALDLVSVCRHNAAVTAAAGRMDLARMWGLAELIVQTPPGWSAAGRHVVADSIRVMPRDPYRLGAGGNRAPPHPGHPLGRALIDRIVATLEARHDIQSLAVFACVFGTAAMVTHRGPGTGTAVTNPGAVALAVASSEKRGYYTPPGATIVLAEGAAAAAGHHRFRGTPPLDGEAGGAAPLRSVHMASPVAPHAISISDSPRGSPRLAPNATLMAALNAAAAAAGGAPIAPSMSLTSVSASSIPFRGGGSPTPSIAPGLMRMATVPPVGTTPLVEIPPPSVTSTPRPSISGSLPGLPPGGLVAAGLVPPPPPPPPPPPVLSTVPMSSALLTGPTSILTAAPPGFPTDGAGLAIPTTAQTMQLTESPGLAGAPDALLPATLASTQPAAAVQISIKLPAGSGGASITITDTPSHAASAPSPHAASDQSRARRFAAYMDGYLDLLFRAQLLEPRAVLARHAAALSAAMFGPAARPAATTVAHAELEAECTFKCETCGVPVVAPGATGKAKKGHVRWCPHCERQRSVRCSLCRGPVRGLAVVCPACGHGGHPVHIRGWFAAGARTCAAKGCECRCGIAAVLGAAAAVGPGVAGQGPAVVLGPAGPVPIGVMAGGPGGVLG
ncbi:hypothetical protein H9P43_007583 [Blastocladiella emersonii ATCC 22665]|nr:hypothetical protein H9P43_007583 [Blastocladiella emersonii ATCC 22665]